MKDIEQIDYEINPHDTCMANKIINNNNHTLTWYLDDVKVSYVEPKVNNKLVEWHNSMCGSLGPVKVKRGKVHDYLGMNLD